MVTRVLGSDRPHCSYARADADCSSVVAHGMINAIAPRSDKQLSLIPLYPPTSDRVCRTSRAAGACREWWQSRGVRQSPVNRASSPGTTPRGTARPLSEVTQGQRRGAGMAHRYFRIYMDGLCYDTQPGEAIPFTVAVSDKTAWTLSYDFYQETLPSKPLAERFRRKIRLL